MEREQFIKMMSGSKMYDLTQDCSLFTPPWPGEKSLEIHFFKRVTGAYGGGQGANGQILDWSNTVGTHLVGETAFHSGARRISDIPLTDLCGSFPQDTGRAFLAYAEAESFTNFLIEKYGQTGLLALTKAYGDGLNCEQGAQRALGQPLSQLEIDWRASALGENAGITALNNLSPYLVVLAVLLAVSLFSALTFKRISHG